MPMCAQSSTAVRLALRPAAARIFTASGVVARTTGGTFTNSTGGATGVDASAGVPTNRRAAPKAAARSFLMPDTVHGRPGTALTAADAALTRAADRLERGDRIARGYDTSVSSVS